MDVVLAGGTGFLGTALQERLRGEGHRVTLLTRSVTPGRGDMVEWRPDGTVGEWSRALSAANVVINLSGAGLADARWTDARRKLLRSSRILSTRSIVTAIRQATPAPPTLVSASGVGYYGDRGAQVVTEATPPGADFLARLCIEWEAEAERAADVTRVVILRNGVVLHPSGGALGKMLPPFRFGLGGPLGSGAQYFPWIHLEDWLDLVMTVISRQDTSGAYNVTAPNPATNADFTRALGHALGRPAVLPVPAFALRAALGELADTLLTGQRAVPQRAEEMGFTFRFRDIEPALRHLLR